MCVSVAIQQNARTTQLLMNTVCVNVYVLPLFDHLFSVVLDEYIPRDRQRRCSSVVGSPAYRAIIESHMSGILYNKSRFYGVLYRLDDIQIQLLFLTEAKTLPRSIKWEEGSKVYKPNLRSRKVQKKKKNLISRNMTSKYKSLPSWN